MPELPEVENVVLSLKPTLMGRNIVKVEINKENLSNMAYKRMFKGIHIDQLKCSLLNGRFKSIKRHGKYILLEIQNSDKLFCLVVHLGMAAALISTNNIESLPANFKKSKHIHVLLTLDNRQYLVFSDIRRFGFFAVLEYKEVCKMFSVFNTVDFFDKDAERIFIKNIRNKKWINKPIKSVIMNQNVIAGIGNIYACEGLHRTKLNPTLSVSQISDNQLISLYKNIKNLMEVSIELGGSSISDYVNGDGKTGKFQDEFRVYNQKQCKDCGSDVQKIKIDRTTHYCSTCQPNVLYSLV